MAGYDWISFTTDYGLSDGFVAVCHGVLARLAPRARVIDVAHLLAPGDVATAATVLAQTVPYLPPAVHLAVVDPGVGTERRAVAVRTAGGLLVGPDNGLLLPAADALGGPEQAVELTNPDWLPRPVSATFHGRDIFAPVAAHLALGAPLAEAGAEIDPADLLRLPEATVEFGDGWLAAQVTMVDRFGNVQLAAAGDALAALGGPGTPVTVGGVRAVVGRTFGSAGQGELVVYPDSADRVAVAMNGGRAVVLLSVGTGDVLELHRT